MDRVPSNATDVFFRPDQVQKVLSAGWGVISYRQNTDLFVQAWHWNPKGTWSDPATKSGYYVGSAAGAAGDHCVYAAAGRLRPTVAGRSQDQGEQGVGEAGHAALRRISATRVGRLVSSSTWSAR